MDVNKVFGGMFGLCAAAALAGCLSMREASPTDMSVTFVAAEQERGAIGVYRARHGDIPETIWLWSAKTDPTVRRSDVRLFGTPDECKLYDDNGLVLMNDSFGGFAGIDVKTGRCRFYGNAGGNPHSVERLPDGRIAVASSTGATLKIFDVSEHPLEPEKQKSVTAMELVGGHGVVWDAQRNALFALGYFKLYELDYDSATMSVKVRRSWDYAKACGDEFGHDLLPDGKGGYYFTNHTAVWQIDPETGRIEKARDLANVKSFSPSAGGDLVAIPRERWWTDTLLVLPHGSSDLKRAHEITLPGARFYKARRADGFPKAGAARHP